MATANKVIDLGRLRKKKLEKLAIERLSATADDTEQWSFLFRTPGSSDLVFCPWSATADWKFDGDTEGLDLPWTPDRHNLIKQGQHPNEKELDQWRRAKCQRLVADANELAKNAWIVPLWVDKKIEAWALFLCYGDDPDTTPFLHGIFDKYGAATAALLVEGAVAFDIESYIGSEIAEFGGNERPPKSARLVGEFDLGSGPGDGDYRTYLISTDKTRSGWTLWLMGHDYDTGKRLYCRVAWGWPYRGYPAQYAAEELLIKSWQDECREGNLEISDASLTRPGLLTEEDMDRIKAKATSESEDA